MAAKYSQCIGNVRVYSDDKSYEDRDDFKTIMSVMWIDDDHARIYAAKGDVNKRDIMDVTLALIDKGANTITMKRKNGRVAPMSRVIDVGDKESVWEVDIDAIKRLSKRLKTIKG